MENLGGIGIRKPLLFVMPKPWRSAPPGGPPASLDVGLLPGGKYCKAITCFSYLTGCLDAVQDGRARMYVWGQGIRSYATHE